MARKITALIDKQIKGKPSDKDLALFEVDNR